MTFRISEPVGREMAHLTADQKELLMAQRHFEYARLTGNFNPLDMIMLGLLDAAEAAGSTDAAAIKAALEDEANAHCGCKAEIGKNYQTRYRVWTERKHGLENAYQCHLCGHWLVSDAPPDELSNTINALRVASAEVADTHKSLQQA